MRVDIGTGLVSRCLPGVLYRTSFISTSFQAHSSQRHRVTTHPLLHWPPDGQSTGSLYACKLFPRSRSVSFWLSPFTNSQWAQKNGSSLFALRSYIQQTSAFRGPTIKNSVLIPMIRHFPGDRPHFYDVHFLLYITKKHMLINVPADSYNLFIPIPISYHLLTSIFINSTWWRCHPEFNRDIRRQTWSECRLKVEVANQLNNNLFAFARVEKYEIVKR